MFLVVYWLTSNVCRQSLGEAAAAALYTESVRQSVGLSQSVGLGLSICKLVLGVSLRESVC